jgi:hypothetical protein
MAGGFALCTFFRAGAAGPWETESKKTVRDSGANNANGGAGQARGPDRNGKGSSKDHERVFIGPDGRPMKLSYDAAKNMVRLHLPLSGGKAHFDSRHGPGWSSSQPGHSERENHRLFGRPRLEPVEQALSHHARSLELLEKSVHPTESRYQSAILAPPREGKTIWEKTRLAIGGVPFQPLEVLGVSLDEAAVARAEALGFKREAASPAGDGGAKVTRFSVPPSIDAIRARELLSQELPGHRFELNKIYRLYRAAMKDGGEAAKAGNAPPAARSCPAERCFARDLIQWQDGLSACARGLRIGVIDTEIDLSHPAFKGRRIHSERFTPDGRSPAPDWHGTGVLSVLAGNPASGTPGLVPDAEFFTAAIFYTEEGGAMATDTVSLMRALSWLEAKGVRLINMSFAGPQDDLVQDQIAEISAKGVVLVAAAGNEGPSAAPAYPAAYPQVIAVTAVTKDQRNYRYANRGEHIDVAAPGAGIWAAVPGGREGSHSGTSFAAPHVTGIIAVMPRESLTGKKDELLDGMPVIDLGAPGRDPVYGRGMLVAPSFCTPPSDALASADPSLAR